MKILFCSPCDSDPAIIVGGINVWARTILGYYNTIKSDVVVEPISFDRRCDVKRDTGLIRRLYYAMKEYPTPIQEAKKALKRKDYDMVHIVTSASLSLIKDLVLIRFAHKYGARAVVHFHFGRTPELLKSDGWESKLIKRVLKKVDASIAMDKKSFDALNDAGYKNVYYLPNPITDSIIEKAEKDGKQIRRFPGKILYVGQVLPTKGVFELVEACKSIEGIQLHIVGKAQEAIIENLKNIIGEYGDRILIRGAMDRDSVFKELLSSELFILPSYSEGFPNVVLEAMACHCPIIATNVGAIPEMLNVEGEACGICIKPKDVDSIKMAIRLVLGNKDQAAVFADRAFERVKDQYSVSVIWKQLVDVWKKSIA